MNNKKYILPIIILIIFLIVGISLGLNNNEEEIIDISNNYDNHIIYYNYDKPIEDEYANEVDDFYDDTNEGSEDNFSSEEYDVPIEIYIKDTIILVRQTKDKEVSYNLNFSSNNYSLVYKFLKKKTNNNQEVYIYKSDLSEAEEIVMNSIINNDEKYLNN